MSLLPTDSTAVTQPTWVFGFACPPALCAYASELLAGLPGVDSVQERYKDNEEGVEEPYEICVYSQFVETEATLLAVLQADELLLPFLGKEFSLKKTVIAQADWAEAWKQYWDVDFVTERLTICPSWLTHTPNHPNEVVLNLDPGCAFGTGAHQTTRLMLKALEWEADNQEPKGFSGQRVLDVGTGSGILAFYAAKRGCKTLLGLDIDPLAVRVARENAVLNGVEAACTFEITPLPELQAQAPFDLILANILGPVLLELMPAFCANLKPGGVLWCSGLIHRSAEEVAEAMAQAGFTNISRQSEAHWLALRGVYQPKSGLAKA